LYSVQIKLMRFPCHQCSTKSKASTPKQQKLHLMVETGYGTTQQHLL
jgi:hypothetical protein